MARKVIWSHEAVKDLQTIADYIAKDSPFYASSFVREIRDAGRTLNLFSERGRIVPEIGKSNTRELFIKEYRLIYRIEELQVSIVAVVHGARDLNKLWSDKGTPSKQI
jgi:toxin ParE1/3/4